MDGQERRSPFPHETVDISFVKITLQPRGIRDPTTCESSHMRAADLNDRGLASSAGRIFNGHAKPNPGSQKIMASD
jgi:hypothetical protein